MPRYYFEIDDGELAFDDTEGSSQSGVEEAGHEAIGALTHLARDTLPDGDVRVFTAAVRDESGKLVFHGTLAFRGIWPR